MFQALILAVSLLGPQAGDAVLLPVQHDRAYAIETRIHRWRRTGDDPAMTADQHLRVEVQPVPDGFKTLWRDLAAPDRTAIAVQTNERLVPLVLSNLDAAWAERGLALVRMSSNNSVAAQEMFEAMPDNARQAMLFKDAILIASVQGLGQAVGEPFVQRLPGQRVGDSPSMDIVSTVTLDSVDRATGKAVITWTTALDPKTVADALPAAVRAVLGLSEEEAAKMEGFDAMLSSARMQNGRNCRYDVDMASGLAETVVCTELQDIDIGGQRMKTEGRMEATQRLIP